VYTYTKILQFLLVSTSLFNSTFQVVINLDQHNIIILTLLCANEIMIAVIVMNNDELQCIGIIPILL